MRRSRSTAVGDAAKLINASHAVRQRPDRQRASVRAWRRRARPEPRAAVPDPGGLLRSRVRAARGPPRGRPGRAQPHAPPGLSQVGVRRRLPAQFDPGVPVQLRVRRRALSRARRPAPWHEARAIAAAALERLCRDRRSARRRIITPIMSRRAGRRCCPRSPSWARTSSIAGPARGACPPPSPVATSASRTIPRRCARHSARGRIVPGVPLGGRRWSPVEIASGPPIARAANDVGGLLDTTKGWTLDIPDPRDTAVASAAVVEQQKQSAVQTRRDRRAQPATALIASR